MPEDGAVLSKKGTGALLHDRKRGMLHPGCSSSHKGFLSRCQGSWRWPFRGRPWGRLWRSRLWRSWQAVADSEVSSFLRHAALCPLVHAWKQGNGAGTASRFCGIQ